MRRWWPAGLLVLVAGAGLLCVASGSGGAHGGDLWPVGLASGVLLLAGPRAWAWLPAVALVAVAGFWLGGRPVEVAVGSGLAITAEVAVVWWVLTAGGRQRPRLHSFADLDRYAAAAVLGAGTAALVGLATSAVTGYGDPELVALAIGASHLSSQLVVLPFFLDPVVESPSAERGEQALAWLAVLVLAPTALLVDDLPALGFLVMPLLLWGALRLGTWQALGQVLVVAVVASVLHTFGYGPVTWLPAGVADPADAAVVLLALFVVGCVLVVVPLVLMVNLRHTSDRRAATERGEPTSVVEIAGPPVEIVDRGPITGWVGTSEDVTEQLEAQQSTELALARIKEVDALEESFISTVSHELRTPVTSIVGYLEMLGDGQFGELSRDQRQAVSRVEANSGRLLALVDDLLTLARTSDDPELDRGRERVALAEVVASGCAVVAPQAEQAGVRLVHRAPGGPDGLVVHGDRQALEGVVINLVGNAVKFTPDGGEVRVDLLQDERSARVCVRDSGIGIPADELELLFTRFFRSSITRGTTIPGSGLGLAIAHDVVQRHAGSIAVESEVGEGTTFTVRLPLAPGAD